VALLALAVSVSMGLPADAESPADQAIRNSENTLRLPEDVPSPRARIQDLAWLAGYWTGPGLGGDTEEMWSPPVGDRMHGIFTLRRDGEVQFSEAMLLVERDGSLVLRVKHFDREFVAWEEKGDSVDFRLVRLGEREAYFQGLTFRAEGDDGLRIFLVLSSGGERSEQVFELRRRPL
jgi:hypothetical protein